MKPKLKEELEEQSLKQKAIEIAKKMAGDMTGAVREIEKLMKGLSKDPAVVKALMTANEQVEQIEKEQPEKEKKEADTKETQIRRLIDQIAVLKQKLENEKNKAVKPEPNPETGEVPLTIGLANKLLKDKEMKKEDVQEAKFRMEGEVDYKNKPNPEDFEMVVNASNRNDAMKQAEINLSRGGKKINALEFSKIIKEADLTKSQTKKVHDKADELPIKDFRDRYGKEKIKYRKQRPSSKRFIRTNQSPKKQS